MWKWNFPKPITKSGKKYERQQRITKKEEQIKRLQMELDQLKKEDAEDK